MPKVKRYSRFGLGPRGKLKEQVKAAKAKGEGKEDGAKGATGIKKSKPKVPAIGPGSVSRALRAIGNRQKIANVRMPSGPMHQLIKEIMHDINDQLQIEPDALEALQQVAEKDLIQLSSMVQRLAAHDNRVTIQQKDVQAYFELLPILNGLGSVHF
ncbi:histone H3 [Fusarium austroafricanum]|uniref:Histone H3 n=1 Tax=Fusarium austroafricanum TaxID=2364996 RepID=A0A8H4NS03_9HYPO|nr:histone H3 [Fusarium austroafricanum]